ncbi:MAG TPA: membrane protein insertion efficiency factor YidD [Patescibacteria group bacterium]|nr:membrane protein insertion efficiency factor YidD [Patescibacteria group bacterium]
MKALLIFLIKSYKKVVSPVFEVLFGKACRFTPTCSEYTIEALEKFGASRGVALGAKRFLRCHPWGGLGFDPVPNK